MYNNSRLYVAHGPAQLNHRWPSALYTLINLCMRFFSTLKPDATPQVVADRSAASLHVPEKTVAQLIRARFASQILVSNIAARLTEHIA